MNEKRNHIESAQEAIAALGLPKAQQNERSALALLALLNLTPERPWSHAEDPLMGITPIMDWARHHYNKEYAPNTRESFRRQTIHRRAFSWTLRSGLTDMPDRRPTTRGKVRAEHHSTIEDAAFASGVADRSQVSAGGIRCADTRCTTSSVGSRVAARTPAAGTGCSQGGCSQGGCSGSHERKPAPVRGGLRYRPPSLPEMRSAPLPAG